MSQLIIAVGDAKTNKTTAATERFEQETARISAGYTPEQQAGTEPPDETVVLVQSGQDFERALAAGTDIIILDLMGNIKVEGVELIE